MRAPQFIQRRDGLFSWAGAVGLIAFTAIVWLDCLTADMYWNADKSPLLATSPGLLLDLSTQQTTPAETYKAFTERPLFHPDRKPFPERGAMVVAIAPKATPSPPPPPPVKPPPQGYTLRGTVAFGSERSAVLERASSKDYVRVEEGSQIDGWIVAKVTRAGILLQSAGQEFLMKLEADPR